MSSNIYRDGTWSSRHCFILRNLRNVRSYLFFSLLCAIPKLCSCRSCKSRTTCISFYSKAKIMILKNERVSLLQCHYNYSMYRGRTINCNKKKKQIFQSLNHGSTCECTSSFEDQSIYSILLLWNKIIGKEHNIFI